MPLDAADTKTKAKTKADTSEDAAASEAPARAKAREPLAQAREPDRKPARPGAMTFKHPLTGEVLMRDPMPTTDSGYHVPKEIIPEGMIYQWRRESTLGEADPANIAALQRNGWRFVPADRHPDRPVRLDGLVLMECPEVFVRQSEHEERQKAVNERRQRKLRNEALVPGYFDDSGVSRTHNFGVRRGAPIAMDDPDLAPQYPRGSVDIDG